MVLIAVITGFSPADPSTNESNVVYEFKQFSTIESVVLGGLGRSRIITTDNGQLVEKELKNFYNIAGINFGNIANNDRVIVERLNDYAVQGWQLVQVSTGSNAQLSEGNSSCGLFITRYLFKREKQ